MDSARQTPNVSKRSSAPVAKGDSPDFYQTVTEILRAARANAYRAVNFAMVEAYWQVGRTIVEEEQRARSVQIMGPNLFGACRYVCPPNWAKVFQYKAYGTCSSFIAAFQFSPHCGEN